MPRHGASPSPGTRERQALAWLAVWRTSGQLAPLIGVTPNHASALLRRLWLRGQLARERVAGVQFRYRKVQP